MDTSKIAHWLQISGNIGILCGLIFVAVQLYQDRQLKGIEMSMHQLDNALAVRLALFGEEPYQALIKSITEPDQLSATEAMVLTQIYGAELILYEQTLYMQRSGLWPEYDLAIPLTMRSTPGYRYVDGNLAILPLADSTKALWRELIDNGEADDILSSVVEGIRNDEAVALLKERYRLALEQVEKQHSEAQ
jgi:hypothetical protein